MQLFTTPWTIAHQVPLSMEFYRKEYCSRVPFPTPGDLPNPRIKPISPALQADSLLSEPSGKPKNTGVGSLTLLQGIFPIQESNQDLLHRRQIHQGILVNSQIHQGSRLILDPLPVWRTIHNVIPPPSSWQVTPLSPLGYKARQISQINSIVNGDSTGQKDPIFSGATPTPVYHHNHQGSGIYSWIFNSKEGEVLGLYF